MKARQVAAVSVIALSALIMTGCTMNDLPDYATVSDETTSAMQTIADTMPDGARVEDLTDATPFTCGEGAGVFYTGHWFVHGPDGFDTAAFINGLPKKVADDFTVEEPGAPVSYPAVLLRSTVGSVRIDVSNPRDNQNPGIDILATSRCAQEPEGSSG